MGAFTSNECDSMLQIVASVISAYYQSHKKHCLTKYQLLWLIHLVVSVLILDALVHSSLIQECNGTHIRNQIINARDWCGEWISLYEIGSKLLSSNLKSRGYLLSSHFRIENCSTYKWIGQIGHHTTLCNYEVRATSLGELSILNINSITQKWFQSDMIRLYIKLYIDVQCRTCYHPY